MRTSRRAQERRRPGGARPRPRERSAPRSRSRPRARLAREYSGVARRAMEAPTVPRMVSTSEPGRASSAQLARSASRAAARADRSAAAAVRSGSALRRRRPAGRRRWCRRASPARPPRGSSCPRPRARGRRARPGSGPRPRPRGRSARAAPGSSMNSRCACVRGRTIACTPSSRPSRSSTFGKSGFDLRW